VISTARAAGAVVALKPPNGAAGEPKLVFP
jgi:hypothetical protein